VIEDDRPTGPKKDSWKIALVKRFILANPTASPSDVVKATRTSLATVTRARRDLIAKGQILPAPTGRPPVPTEGPTPEEDAAADEAIRKDIDAAIAAGKAPLTRAERRQRLSAYADHPKVPTAAKIQALKELEATEPPDSEVLGPGAPLTKEDALERGGLIVEAIYDMYGPEAAKDAINRGLRGASSPLEFAFITVVEKIMLSDGEPHPDGGYLVKGPDGPPPVQDSPDHDASDDLPRPLA